MIRPGFEKLQPASWTFDEGLLHLRITFQQAFVRWPDLIEPYVIQLEGAADDVERKSIMRAALRETFAARYPSAVRVA